MGAIDFEHTIYGDYTMDEAYSRAVDEATIEWGTDPYNGTISTTEGVQLSPLATSSPTPITQINQEDLTTRLHDLSKWGPCEAIPILDVHPAEHESIPGFVTAHLSVRSNDLTQDETYRAINTAMNEYVRKQIRQHHAVTTLNRPPRLGGATATVHDLPWPAKDYRATVHDWSFSGNPKATTRATKGTAQTRYFILQGNDPYLPRWESGYSTQARARAALPTTLPQGGAHHHADYSIIAITRRENGQNLVEYHLDATAHAFTTIHASATLARFVCPAQVTDRKGWFFYGMAAS